MQVSVVCLLKFISTINNGDNYSRNNANSSNNGTFSNKAYSAVREIFFYILNWRLHNANKKVGGRNMKLRKSNRMPCNFSAWSLTSLNDTQFLYVV